MSVEHCPQCGAPIAPDDTECRYCGEAFPFNARPSSATKQQPPSYSRQDDYRQYNAGPSSTMKQPPSYSQTDSNAYQYDNTQAQYPKGTPQNPYVQSAYDYNVIDPAWPIKNKVVAGLLGIFLGAFGIHKFYMGKVGLGILYAMFFWTGLPAFVGFIEGIIYLASSDHNFQVMNRVRLQ